MEHFEKHDLIKFHPKPIPTTANKRRNAMRETLRSASGVDIGATITLSGYVIVDARTLQ